MYIKKFVDVDDEIFSEDNLNEILKELIKLRETHIPVRTIREKFLEKAIEVISVICEQEFTISERYPDI